MQTVNTMRWCRHSWVWIWHLSLWSTPPFPALKQTPITLEYPFCIYPYEIVESHIFVSSFSIYLKIVTSTKVRWKEHFIRSNVTADEYLHASPPCHWTKQQQSRQCCINPEGKVNTNLWVSHPLGVPWQRFITTVGW